MTVSSSVVLSSRIVNLQISRESSFLAVIHWCKAHLVQALWRMSHRKAVSASDPMRLYGPVYSRFGETS
jgi:hypothetical protein